MTKNEHIEYWIKSANDDWEAVQSLLNSKKYVQCLFFAHLVLEKFCKANWVKNNINNVPPRTHNLVKLLMETNVQLNDEDLQFLVEFNDFQLEGRYPDYQFAISKKCNFEFTTITLDNVKKIKKFIQDSIL